MMAKKKADNNSNNLISSSIEEGEQISDPNFDRKLDMSLLELDLT